MFRKFVEKIQVSLKSDKNNGTSHEDQYTFMIATRSFLLVIKNISEKKLKGKSKHKFYIQNL